MTGWRHDATGQGLFGHADPTRVEARPGPFASARTQVDPRRQTPARRGHVIAFPQVGGQLASCPSKLTTTTGPPCRAPHPRDGLALERLAGLVFHALECLAGKQSLVKIRNFRECGSVRVEGLPDPRSRNCLPALVANDPPTTLPWLGSVRGCLAAALGVEHFVESESVANLIRQFGIDRNSISGVIECPSFVRPLRTVGGIG